MIKQTINLISLIIFQSALLGQITFEDRTTQYNVGDPGNASGVAFVDYDQA